MLGCRFPMICGTNPAPTNPDDWLTIPDNSDDSRLTLDVLPAAAHGPLLQRRQDADAWRAVR